MHEKIIIAGEGGQGVQSIADILAEAAFLENKESLYIPNFGIEQRGGVSLAYVQVAEKPIGSPKFQSATVAVALSERAMKRMEGYITNQTILIYDSSLIQAPEVDDQAIGFQVYDTEAPELFAETTSPSKKNHASDLPKAREVIGVKASDLAREEFHPRVFNMIVLGVIQGVTGVVNENSIIESLFNKLKSKFQKNPDLKDLNEKAFAKGREFAMEVKNGQKVQV